MDIYRHLNFLDSVVVEEVLERYREPHRHFHTIDHVVSILDQINLQPNLPSDVRRAMRLAAVFHDIVYNPMAVDNEEQSARLMHRLVTSAGRLAEDLILGTKIVDMHQCSDPNIRLFNEFDRNVLYGTFPELLVYSEKIRREYNRFSYREFVDGHLKAVHALLLGSSRPNSFDLDAYEAVLRSRKLRVGVYAGSFNPFHVGHRDILRQAQALFDKVIMARGVNPDKHDGFLADFSISREFHPKVPRDVETIAFTGLLSDLVTHLETSEGYDVTVVKGLRNASDMESEFVQQQFVQSLAAVKYVYLASDVRYRHMSSSALRTLQAFGKDISAHL